MPQSSNIFINFSGGFNGSFHENKIHQLERFIKDLSEIKVISNSKIFKKFLEFNQNFDEENEIIYNINNPEEDINLQNDKFNNVNDNGSYNNRYNNENKRDEYE